MKGKVLIVSLLVSAALIIGVIFCVEFNKKNENGNGDETPSTHEHTYATDWSNDENNHWHA